MENLQDDLWNVFISLVILKDMDRTVVLKDILTLGKI